MTKLQKSVFILFCFLAAIIVLYFCVSVAASSLNILQWPKDHRFAFAGFVFVLFILFLAGIILINLSSNEAD